MISRFQARWRRAGWRELVLLVAAATFFLALWCFVAVAGIVSTGNYTGLENRIMQSLRATDDPRQPIGPDWLPAAARDVTALGSAAVLIIVVALVIGWLALRRDHATALLILVATAGGSGLGHALKQIFDRARPEAVSHLVEVRSLSFPSGHSFNASVVYLTLGALLARTVVRRREKIYFIQGALFLALIVGLSRVYLGVHYPTDVLAGWSAGTAWALVCWYAALRLQRRGVLPAGAADEKRAAAD